VLDVLLALDRVLEPRNSIRLGLKPGTSLIGICQLGTEASKLDESDAVLFPANFGANPPARAGYPSVIVPGGFFPNPALELPAGFDAKPSPFGVTFSGPAFSEPMVLRVAAAYEAAAQVLETARGPLAQRAEVARRGLAAWFEGKLQGLRERPMQSDPRFGAEDARAFTLRCEGALARSDLNALATIRRELEALYELAEQAKEDDKEALAAMVRLACGRGCLVLPQRDALRGSLSVRRVDQGPRRRRFVGRR